MKGRGLKWVRRPGFPTLRPHVQDSLHHGRGSGLGNLRIFFPSLRPLRPKQALRVETRDISLSGRILAAMAEVLPQDQKTHDALAELGALAKTPEANIVKLPNISASIPQLKAAIAELQNKDSLCRTTPTPRAPMQNATSRPSTTG